jgi:hypothetical protein
MTIDMLEQVLSRTALSPSQLKSLQAALAQLDQDQSSLLQAFKGEKCAFSRTDETYGMDAVKAVGELEHWIEASYSPFHEFLAEAKQTEEPLSAPANVRTIVASARHTARLRLARTALAVERYRQEFGVSPLTLEELVPLFLEEPLTDPFDGMPFHYRYTETGYFVYSVADDLIDEGGEGSQEKPPRDIAFAVENVQVPADVNQE